MVRDKPLNLQHLFDPLRPIHIYSTPSQCLENEPEQMKTYNVKPTDIKKQWLIVDAKEIGRAHV